MLIRNARKNREIECKLDLIDEEECVLQIDAIGRYCEYKVVACDMIREVESLNNLEYTSITITQLMQNNSLHLVSSEWLKIVNQEGIRHGQIQKALKQLEYASIIKDGV